jgi:hypothetical protein
LARFSGTQLKGLRPKNLEIRSTDSIVMMVSKCRK